MEWILKTSLKFSRSRQSGCALPGLQATLAAPASSGGTDHAGTLAPTRMPAKQNPRALSNTKEVP